MLGRWLLPLFSTLFSEAVDLCSSLGRDKFSGVNTTIPYIFFLSSLNWDVLWFRTEVLLSSISMTSPSCTDSLFNCCLHRIFHICIATGYGLDDQEVRVRVPVGANIFTSPRRPHRLWGHTTSYPLGTGGSFPGGKAAGAWSWPFISN
jgi:hypothetical protein